MIFSILNQKSDNILEHKGTGFVVNKKGLFITAGHVVANYHEDIMSLFIAFPDEEKASQLYSFQKLYYEYFDPRKASTPRDFKRKNLPNREDIFIGRILKYKNPDHLKLKRKRPQEDEQLISKGIIKPAENEFTFNNGKVDLRSLNLTLQRTPISERGFCIISDDDKDYEKLPSSVDYWKKYNNCMWLKFPIGNGSSGGPVVDSNGYVVGIISSGNPKYHALNIICSKYIREKYRHI